MDDAQYLIQLQMDMCDILNKLFKKIRMII